MLERNKRILEKIIKYCNTINEILNQINYDSEKYKKQNIFQLSTDMCVYQIGELSVHVDEDLKKQHLEIPWAQMKGMRNIHAHEYDNIDRDKMWYTLINDIPDLKRKIEKIINSF